ncbi:site-specific DNA-methyltransferase [Schnuerera ultunensis]|uniref:Adenine specific DNA methylase Mod n=1 Tax=[Clostridium] ultunense Esp TaxID=1288971 RepID=A0A1M4PPZ6_9FIRM|nr:site-specific DNA-methyltransferase [Schnuerera ultunensis]SHD77558.1 Adenine specific DNA methylase Mod [[Clostridium] ultunense Esp]
MDKLKMKSRDLTKGNIEKIGELFPNVVTEIKDEKGNVTKAIDFELLQQELSDEIVEGNKERYQLTWPGKKDAIVTANTPIDKTLRPVKEDSLNWEATENLYIEGDNLEVLKLLQESYLGRIKCIYIDPPYNTGNDFIYRDNFAQDKDEYLEESGQVDEEGNRLFQNTEYNGRYHSDWLTMMYPRLKLARNLLSEDGVIFISIDDNEVHNLRKICDEVFGERNFVGDVIWERAYAPVNLKKHFSENHDYIVSYAKNIGDLVCKGLKRSDEADARYQNPDNDPRGPWTSSDLSVGPIVQEKIYEIITPSGRRVLPPEGYCWRYTRERFEEMLNDNRIWFGENGDNVPRIKRFLSEVKSTVTPMTIWKHKEVGHSQEAKRELNKLFDGKAYFDYPKSVKLIKRILELYTDKNSIILDFFSGSATTAHAAMDLNAEDGGNRKYIMVQLPEPTDEKSEAYKAGYENIAEIGKKERIRRAGKKIKEETGADIDYGFRVYKVDSSNMKDIYYRPDELEQNMLDQLESNIKEDRTSLDLLTQVMLEVGLELSLPMETKEIRGKEVHFVAGNSLVACFDEDVDEELIKEIAKIEPLKAVFRDNSFKSCPDKINLEEIFEGISPNTDIRVL